MGFLPSLLWTDLSSPGKEMEMYFRIWTDFLNFLMQGIHSGLFIVLISCVYNYVFEYLFSFLLSMVYIYIKILVFSHLAFI